jgi:hypothetical protein
MAKKETTQDLTQDFRDQMEALGLDEQANIILKNPFNSSENKEARQDILGSVSMDPDSLDMVVRQISPKGMYTGGLLSDDMERMPYQTGKLVGDLNNDGQMSGYEQARQNAIEENMREQKQEGGAIVDQMSMLMPDQPQEEMLPETPMESDEEMEDNYLDFIIDEALSEEEEDMLMSKLEQDEQLSMLFDKVIEVASEFAGSGPVEGPGSGVSDSIPARLSDGEFVFTAKAVEEIGADNLMAMMKDAEMKADERQGLAEGGQPEEEEIVVMPVEQPASQQDIRVTKTTVGSEASQQEVNDLVDEEVKKSMLRGSRNLG